MPDKVDIFRHMKDNLSSAEIPAEIVAVYLYGSALEGRLRGDSDIDIAILPSPNVAEDDVLRLISIMEDIVTKKAKEIGLNNKVSVFNLKGRLVSVLLQYSVISNGSLIYELQQLRPYRRAFENYVKSEYFDFIPYYRELTEIRHGKAEV
ncbi:hypothetical protein JZK55_18280 [Dissulfurispira thermophila]|uniref:Polymerase beta nucleotidyltransferase domain-containing protein n=2 Tax=root TaxID=1 RepID=A0A7G1H4T0_9BACT|nr:nucleotidyltransferase domain-containing protein [Dissulfurispira thermophila]BCB96906.1 hypothetical protein JZK55_18280 [Dissulfurispira thermophila]